MNAHPEPPQQPEEPTPPRILDIRIAPWTFYLRQHGPVRCLIWATLGVTHYVASTN